MSPEKEHNRAGSPRYHPPSSPQIHRVALIIRIGSGGFYTESYIPRNAPAPMLPEREIDRGKRETERERESER